MKNQATKIFLSFLFSTVFLLSTDAEAARYLVSLKNRQVFYQIHSQVQLSNHSQLNHLVLMTSNGKKLMPFASVPDAEIEQSLAYVKTLVINSESEINQNDLLSSGLIESVEPEIFRKAPRPFPGFRLTQAWDYSLAQAVNSEDYTTSANAPTESRAFAVSTSPNLPWGISAIRAPQAWTLGARGQGSRVLVLDTGIDKFHPALKDALEEGQNFVGDLNTPYDIADSVGHGTHVSGSILARKLASGFAGVAPEARLLMGRVCNDQFCSNVAVVSGINWGIKMKVDVINMSLGAPNASATEIKAIEEAGRQGITIVAASGNGGVDHVDFPGALPTVIGVGAITQKGVKANFSQWGPELDLVAPGTDVMSTVPTGTGLTSEVTVSADGLALPLTIPSEAFYGCPLYKDQPLEADLVYIATGAKDEFDKANVAGKIVLMNMDNPLNQKMINSIKYKSIGVLFVAGVDGLELGDLRDEKGNGMGFPVLTIDKEAGEKVVDLLKSGKKLKVQLTISASDFMAFPGTSMAAPHVAGLVALMKSVNKDLSPLDVHNILKATASPISGVKDRNLVGSGLINAEKAVNLSINYNKENLPASWF